MGFAAIAMVGAADVQNIDILAYIRISRYFRLFWIRCGTCFHTGILPRWVDSHGPACPAVHDPT